jgi:sulfoxide reductase heme-binding subunit YedZ
MRAHPAALDYVWWLASRASGIVALLLVTASVGIGLTMASKVLRRRRLGPALVRVHEQTAVAGLVAIGVHAVTLLFDPWLHPGVTGVLVPFAMGYRSLYTGLGVVAAYLAVLLGLSFYVRRTIGARLWRKLHRATVVVWALGVVHALGAGTDAGSAWLQALALATGAPIVALFAVRVLRRPAPRRSASSPARKPPPAHTASTITGASVAAESK